MDKADFKFECKFSSNTYLKFSDLAAATLWLLDFKNESNIKEGQYSKVPVKPIAQFNFLKKELVISNKQEPESILLPFNMREKCQKDDNTHNLLFRAEIKLSKDDMNFKTAKGESHYDSIFDMDSKNKFTKKNFEMMLPFLEEKQNEAYIFASRKNHMMRSASLTDFNIRQLKEDEQIHYNEFDRLASLEPARVSHVTKGGASKNFNANLKRVAKDLSQKEFDEYKKRKMEKLKPVANEIENNDEIEDNETPEEI